MSQLPEDKDSVFKLAQLRRAFERKLDVKFIEKILQTKGDINYRVLKNNEYVGSTALDFAIINYRSRQNPEVFQQLLRHGADFTVKNNEGETALRKLLDRITLYNDSYPYSGSWGLRDKLSDEVVDVILSEHCKKSISKNPGDKYGLTDFHIACMANHPVAVQMFLNNGVSVDLAINEDSPFFPGCTPLDVATRSCALEVVKVLLKYFDDPLAKEKAAMKAIHWLIECNKRIVDSFIIEVGGVPPEKWLSKFKINQQIINLLYDSKSCSFISEIGLSSVHIACTMGNISMLEDLLDQVVPVDQQVNVDSHLCPGYTSLHFAAYVDLKIVHFLLARGANILIESADGTTPFDICVERYGVKDIWHFIMSTQSNWEGITLLDGRTKLINLVSAMQDIGQFRSFLDQHVGNINTSVSKSSPLWPGYTPLHLAVLFTEQTKNRSNYTIYTREYSTGTRLEAKFVPNFELVEECLSRGADVTAKDLFGTTPLHLAFHHQKTDTITKLLQFHHNSLNPIDKNNVSHLHIACASRDKYIVKKLLQSGAKIDLPVLSDFEYYSIKSYSNYPDVKRIPVGSTPLHIAVTAGNRKIAKLLVDSGADVNAVDGNGVTAIHRLFIENSEKNTARILLSANLQEVIVSGAGISHLHVASYFGDVDAVKRLLDLGADIQTRMGCQSAMDNLCQRYYYKSWAPKYRWYGINYWNYCKGTAWHIAVQRQDSDEVAELLTSRGADFWEMMNNEGISLKMIFCSESLIQNNALAKRVEEAYGLTALHLACYEGSPDTVRKLIDKGMNVNAQVHGKADSWLGYTPLHMLIACYADDFGRSEEEDFQECILDITQMLLGAGANVTLCDKEGYTPLHSWILGECFTNGDKFDAGMLSMMLNRIENFHVNPVPTSSIINGELKMSHFHIACFQNNTTIIRKFLEHGVDVNAAVDFFSYRNEGSSALHLLVDEENHGLFLPKIEAIDALLEYGADVNAQDVYGDTPLHVIARFAPDRVDVLERFISAGADFNKLNIVYETPFTTLLLSKKATPEAIGLFIKHECCVNDFNIVDQQGCLSRPLFAYNSVMEDRDTIFEALFKSLGLTELDAMGRTAIHNIVSAAAFTLPRHGFGIDLDLKNVSVDEYSSLITRLCNKGCDINSRDQLGRTALHLAARFKNNKAVVALLMNGADANITDSGGIAAFNYSFNSCECKQFENTHQHNDLITTFNVHMRKLKYLNLNVNEINRNMVTKANLELDLTDISMDNFYKEVSQVNAMIFEEDSTSFNFKDLLSETGIVAVYPFKESLRLILDKFFQNVDEYLADYKEVIGLFKLQVRKAKNRTKLIESAADSLNLVVGFPFPELCRQRILSFLSNSDFENLIFITYHAKFIIPDL